MKLKSNKQMLDLSFIFNLYGVDGYEEVNLVVQYQAQEDPTFAHPFSNARNVRTWSMRRDASMCLFFCANAFSPLYEMIITSTDHCRKRIYTYVRAQ